MRWSPAGGRAAPRNESEAAPSCLRSHPHLGIIVLLKGTDAAVLLELLRWYTPLVVAGAIANYDIALLPRHAQQLHPELLCHDLVLC